MHELTKLYSQFLMHRVELKDPSLHSSHTEVPSVPNAPCGVERTIRGRSIGVIMLVPNIPCGVEGSKRR